MDEIKIQTGWCDELCMQSRGCISILQETVSALAGMRADVQTFDEETRQSFLKLQNRIEQTKERMERIESFLQNGIFTYERLERSLTMQAQQMTGGLLLSEPAQNQWAQMFYGEADAEDNTTGE